MLQLSVVIVNYNVKHFVHQTLLSVERATADISHEIFVVDNNSTDGSVGYLQPLHPQVRYIWNKENVGFARANNQAIRKARGEFILLLNPDTLIGEDTLHECIELMKQRPDAGAIGVRMLNRDGTFAPESRRGVPTPFTAFCKVTGLCRLFPSSRTFGRYYMQYLDASHVNEIEVISGAFMFLRRTTLRQSGLLDEDYFMYGEDVDLSYRILQTGLKNLYLPTSILHYKGESTHKNTYHYVRVFHQAMLIFFRKHFGHYNILFALPVNLAILLVGALTYLRMKFRRSARGSADDPLYFLRTASLHYQPSDVTDDAAPLNSFLEAHGLPTVRSCSADAWPSDPQPDYVVFNAEKTPYAEMLRLLEHQPAARLRSTLATWYPSQQLLITPNIVVS